MSGKKIIEGLEEAIGVARGEDTGAVLHHLPAHSPLPWGLECDGGYGALYADDGGRRIHIASISGSVNNPEIMADAKHIVRAVNSYDTHRALIAELVGAIENTLPRLRADTDDPEGIDWSAEIAAFEAVVAKAKSESAP